MKPKLSAPSILQTRVQVQSTSSTLLSFIVKFVLYLSLDCEKERKEAGFGNSDAITIVSAWDDNVYRQLPT